MLRDCGGSYSLRRVNKLIKEGCFLILMWLLSMIMVVFSESRSAPFFFRGKRQMLYSFTSLFFWKVIFKSATHKAHHLLRESLFGGGTHQAHRLSENTYSIWSLQI